MISATRGLTPVQDRGRPHAIHTTIRTACLTSAPPEPGHTWRNQAAARIALRVGSYRPGRHADQIAAPILFAIAQDDAITPAVLAHAAAARAPHAEVRTYPGSHFDIYIGATFERAVSDQVEFLTRHLLRS